MATKDYSLPFRDRHNSVINDTTNDQYSNLNLNQKLQSFKIQEQQISESTKSISNEKGKILNYDFSNHDTRKDSHSWKKSTKYLNLGNIGYDKNENRLKKEKNHLNIINRSALSLYIAAYENQVETSTDWVDGINGKSIKKENGKQILAVSKSVIQIPFEFPRQQKSDEIKVPEVAQFRTSQQLLNPMRLRSSRLVNNQANNQQTLPQDSDDRLS
uniref:Uncharacterized protein n=1 Tax=Panagrolaimus sp. PS1159 TaxID=55785 RepID=A0AC35FDF3_9BILA